jgi:hypothetical protein
VPREFITRTPDDDDDAAIDAVAGREQELASYDANVDAYTAQLVSMDSALPAEWPEGLQRYKGKSNEQIAVIGGELADMELAAAMNHRDRVRMLLFTEKAERAKSEAAYAYSLTLLPKNQAKRTAAINRQKARIEARKARQ